jgi:hypothetical protein
VTPPPAVWEDEDDELLEVNLDDTDRLKKLKTKTKKGKSIVSGTEFSSLLKERCVYCTVLHCTVLLARVVYSSMIVFFRYSTVLIYCA